MAAIRREPSPGPETTAPLRESVPGSRQAFKIQRDCFSDVSLRLFQGFALRMTTGQSGNERHAAPLGRLLVVDRKGEALRHLPGFGRFPLRHVDDYASTVPAEWMEQGGVLMPMYQSEALWISFNCAMVRDGIRKKRRRASGWTGWPNMHELQVTDAE